MGFADFLTAPETTVARELLLHSKATYEMRLHASREGQSFQITEPEIDNEGFDFGVLVDYSGLYIQNKAAIRPGGARSWKVLAKFLKPHFDDRLTVPELDGRRVGGYEVGATGCVLVHLVDRKFAVEYDDLCVSYLFFDIYYAVAVAAGYIKAGFTSAEALALLRTIRDAAPNDRIEIKQRHCIKIKSPASVLAFRYGIGGYNYISPLPKILTDEPQVFDTSPLANQWRKYLSLWMR